MNFEHTEERRMLADTLDRYLAQQYPIATRHAAARSAQGYSTALWQGLAELGALGALFPEVAGGWGGSGFDVALVFESLGKGLAIEPVLGTLMVGRALLAAGTPVPLRWLPGLMNGGTVAALAHEEPDGHYESGHVGLQARRNAQGYVLHGRKAVVPQGEQAGLLLVSARSSGGVDDADGISLFLVPGDTPGLLRQGYARVDGGRAAELDFQALQLPASALLGGEGQGLALLELALGWGVLALCAEALGAMAVTRDMTLDYLRTRRQFGVPIGSFQALQHRMATLALDIEQARSAVINAAAAMEAGRRTRERLLAAAKYSVGHIGTQVAEECIQLHGGIGMTWELPLTHYAKRLVMINHQLGDEDHHLARFMALSEEAQAAQT